MMGDATRGNADVVMRHDKNTWAVEDHPREKAEHVHEVDKAHGDADAGSDDNDGSGVAAAVGSRVDTDERDSTKLELHLPNLETFLEAASCGSHRLVGTHDGSSQ
jgi:hypothetical protein